MAVLGLAACAGDEAVSDGESHRVSVTLDYAIDGLHSPLFVARVKGFYDDARLEVDIRPSGGSSEAIARVGAGQANLGLASAGTVLGALASDDPPHLRVVGALLQHNAEATIALRESGIRTPTDLRGKKVADSPSTSEHFLFPALLSANDLGANDVERVSAAPSAIISLLADKQVDAINNYVQVAAALSGKVDVMPWYEHGVDGYGTVVIANDAYLADHDDEVEDFLASTFRGLRYVVDNGAEAGQITAKAADAEAPFFTDEIALLGPLWTPVGDQSGRMVATRWEQTQELNVKYAQQTKRLDIGKVFTNRYLGG